MSTTADRIRQARKKLGLTQSEFGKIAGNARKQAVSSWERGSSEPSLESLLALEANTGISHQWIQTARDPQTTLTIRLPEHTAKMVRLLVDHAGMSREKFLKQIILSGIKDHPPIDGAKEDQARYQAKEAALLDKLQRMNAADRELAGAIIDAILSRARGDP